MQWQQAVCTGQCLLLLLQRKVKELSDVYTFAGKTINFDTLEIHAGERVTRLTLMEADLLRYLLGREGRVVSRKEILEEVLARARGYGYVGRSITSLCGCGAI